MARLVKMAKEDIAITRTVSMSPKEWEKIKAMAREANMSISQYVRKRLGIPRNTA